MDNQSCVFCKIIAEKIPSTVIAVTDDILVIKDIAPKAPIHYLIMPKKHIQDLQSLADADRQLACNMFFMAQKLSQDLAGTKAFRLVANNGHDAGQRVFHLHLHFLAGSMFDF